MDNSYTNIKLEIEKINDEITPFGNIKDRLKNNNILKFY